MLSMFFMTLLTMLCVFGGVGVLIAGMFGIGYLVFEKDLHPAIGFPLGLIWFATCAATIVTIADHRREQRYEQIVISEQGPKN